MLCFPIHVHSDFTAVCLVAFLIFANAKFGQFYFGEILVYFLFSFLDVRRDEENRFEVNAFLCGVVWRVV